MATLNPPPDPMQNFKLSFMHLYFSFEIMNDRIFVSQIDNVMLHICHVKCMK